MTLGSFGFWPVSATGGAEALKILRQPDPPQIIFLDVNMPGMDGLEVCRQIRRTPELKHLYIILLTGNTETIDLVNGIQAGADDYITKPFNRVQLRVRLNTGLRILALQKELAAKSGRSLP
jgi:DNA-binding response OmpR family regulator